VHTHTHLVVIWRRRRKRRRRIISAVVVRVDLVNHEVLYPID